MNKMQRIYQAYKLPIFRATGFIVTGFLCMLLSVNTFAAGPSAGQLAMFKNLPAAEQQRLARQMGVALPSAKGIQQAPIQVLETVKVRSVGQQSIIENNSGNVSEAREESKEQVDERFSASAEKNNNKEETKTTLKQFGYDLFAGVPTTFAPVSNVPVPTEYIIGPGDTVKVQLYGKNNASYELNVTRDGLIQFPDVGPMPVAGLTFKELKTHIQDTVSRQIIGAKVSITMGNLRSIRIFVLGEAYRPGSYTVGALSTMT
ncbi:MAG: polysaccharide biosynthesis/export family protein, partial [Gammaproteobacteria bacterium]|nr:polysaccharide biosynthesis/export family protein [Gammaproteobacteria bacterium]